MYSIKNFSKNLNIYSQIEILHNKVKFSILNLKILELSLKMSMDFSKSWQTEDKRY